MRKSLNSSGFCLPYDKSLVARAKQMRQNPTLAETLIQGFHVLSLHP